MGSLTQNLRAQLAFRSGGKRRIFSEDGGWMEVDGCVLGHA